MAAFFFDSSGIVKRYVSETGTAWVVGLTNPESDNRIYVANITGVEVVSAITRRERNSGLSMADAVIAITDFRHDFANAYRVFEVSPGLIDRAMSLAETHALRGYDAVQLAAALTVRDRCIARGISVPMLISADVDLNAAATAEGLAVDDPNAHP